jgi:hypothetical protein
MHLHSWKLAASSKLQRHLDARRNNNISIVSTPTFSLDSIHLAPAPVAAVNNNEHQRQVEKQISLDIKKDVKTKLSI